VTRYPSAYSFASSLDLDAMKLTLNCGSYAWRLADNETYGLYLVTRLADGISRLRIFPDGERFIIDIRSNSSRPEAIPRGSVDDIVFSVILPAIGGRDVQPSEAWE
jgi:hypothetical protein